MSYFHISWLLLSVVGVLVMVFITPVLQQHFGFVLNDVFLIGATAGIPLLSGLIAYLLAKYRTRQLHPGL